MERTIAASSGREVPDAGTGTAVRHFQAAGCGIELATTLATTAAGDHPA